MELIWILTGFFGFITIVFVALAIFFPEWVGITGNKAKAVQRHLQGEDMNVNLDSHTKTNSSESDSTSNKPQN